MRRLAIVLAISILAVPALMITGCQNLAEKAAEKAVEKATGVKVDEDGGKVTFTGEDGESVEFSGEEGKLPEDFPEGVPVYEGEITGSSKVSSNEGTQFHLNIETDDEAGEVIDWLEAELSGTDWEVSDTVKAEYDGMVNGQVVAKRGEDEAVISVVSEPEAPTSVTYFIGTR